MFWFLKDLDFMLLGKSFCVTKCLILTRLRSGYIELIIDQKMVFTSFPACFPRVYIRVN